MPAYAGIQNRPVGFTLLLPRVQQNSLHPFSGADAR
jgi:hypothetical protein